jgi:hypothetical protein
MEVVMSKVILHFTNLDTFATEIAEDEMDVFYTEWDKHSKKDAFETISTAWIKPCDVLWIEFSKDRE